MASVDKTKLGNAIDIEDIIKSIDTTPSTRTKLSTDDLDELINKVKTLNLVFDDLKDDDLKNFFNEVANGGRTANAVIKELKKSLSELDGILKSILDKEENIFDGMKKYREQEKDSWIKERKTKKLGEFANLEEKKEKIGLKFDEKTSYFLSKFGESLNINTDKLKTAFDEIKNGANKLYDVGKKIADPWGKIDQVAFDYSKHIGMSKQQTDQLRKSTIDFVNSRMIGSKYNVSMEELVKLQQGYNTELGRSINLTDNQKESFAAMSSIMGEQSAIDMTTKLENFGLNPEEASKRASSMFQTANKHGLVFEKYSKNFLNNIKLAQNYTFANGLRGLEAMAEKATAIRLDMQQVSTFADKVSTLEGAMQAGASLSVLGGSFAQFGNPLSMMYEGLNDMESLQDRIIKMYGEMGKWDYKKNQVDVSAFNRQRIKAAAQATGMDYSNIMEMINTSARRNIVSRQLENYSNLSEDTKKKIRNVAQLDERGHAFVTINDEKRELSQLSNSDSKYLSIQGKDMPDNIKDIATTLRGWDDIITGGKKQQEAIKAQVGEIAMPWLKEKISKISQNETLMKLVTLVPLGFAALGGFLTMINGSILGIKSLSGGIGGQASTTSTGGASASGSSVFGKGLKGISGKQFLARGMAGAAFSGVGYAVGSFADTINKTDHQVGYTATKALSGAAYGAGVGMMLGGPVGAGIGAGIGAIIGGVKGYTDAEDEQLRKKILEDYGISLRGEYSNDELRDIKNKGIDGVDGGLRYKIREQDGYNKGGSVLKNISGGYTGDMSTIDFAGRVGGKTVEGQEFVVRAPYGKQYKDQLEQLNGGIKWENIIPRNTMPNMNVSSNVNSKSNIGPSNFGAEKVSFDTLKIEVSGSIAVTGNDRDIAKIDGKQLVDAILSSPNGLNNLMNGINGKLNNTNLFSDGRIRNNILLNSSTAI